MLNEPTGNRAQENVMTFIRQKIVSRADLRANPDVLYVFGDNEERWGLGGQAKEMRGELNAVGVATLKSPGEFWHYNDNPRQCAVIDADMAPLFEAAAAGRVIVFPLDGIGTGLADLERRSAMTFAHLVQRISELERAAS
jgi:hypothetical protein